MVVDHIRGLTTGVPVAFFCFDYQDEDKQSPTAVLSSLVKQLVTTMPDFPRSVFEAYKKYQNSGSLITTEELERLMQDVLQRINQAVIIIDALDECDKSRHRKPFLLLLKRLQQISHFRLLVTSRQNFQDITDAFKSYPQITITAHEVDIERYMRQEIELAGVEEIIDDSFANYMIKAVVNKAQGM